MVPRFGRGHWFWIHTRLKRVQSFGDRRSKLVQASKKIGSQASGGEASAGPSGLARGRGRSRVYGGEGPGGGNALPRSAGAAGQALSEAGPVLGKGTEIGTGACATSSTCSRRRGSGLWGMGSGLAPTLALAGLSPPYPPFPTAGLCSGQKGANCFLLSNRFSPLREQRPLRFAGSLRSAESRNKFGHRQTTADKQTRGAGAPRGSCKYQISARRPENTRHGWVGNGSLSDESRIRGELPLTTLGRRNERRRPAPPSARAN